MVKTLFLLSALAASVVVAYEVPIVDKDYSRQICSGMWTNEQTYISVSFDSSSQGQLAMVIYEWTDAPYLGKITSLEDDYLPKTYVCTSDAVRGGYCGASQLGRFILDLPQGSTINDTSFWSARVAFPTAGGGDSSSQDDDTTTTPDEDTDTDTDEDFTELEPSSEGDNAASSDSFWDNPEGMPSLPEGEDDVAWRRPRSLRLERRQTINPSPTTILTYQDPIQYLVRKTGYYCVAVVPVTVLSSSSSPSSSRALEHRQTTTSGAHPTYEGVVHFHNTFDGELAATEYPKVTFYLVMFLVYAALGGAWAWLCYRHLSELLPLQYYLSGLVGFLIIEMLANLAYYRYLNAHGKNTVSTVFLFVVAILDAGRNSLSFFMLLVVSLGLSVVRDDLGSTMRKCQILAGAHFVFGVLYAVGIVELEFESTSALVLLMFVIPLAFTLSGFLMWILYSLNATIAQLKARKQRYKLSMFQKLHYILLFVVVVIAIFFVVSSLSFSGRLAEDYAAKTWKVRWWLLDGWLALLYLIAFTSIAYLWRPSENNRRLMMSDELAQDEDDVTDGDGYDYDPEALELRSRRPQNSSAFATADDDDDATLVGGHRGGSVIGRGRGGDGESVRDDTVVLEIGDEDAQDLSDEEEEESKSPGVGRGNGNRRGNGHGHGRDREDVNGARDDERQGLMGVKDRDD